MGGIQEPTPDMGQYKIEARSESFILGRTGRPGDLAGSVVGRRGRHFFIPFKELPQLLAALTQAASCAALAPAPKPPGSPDIAEVLALPWNVETGELPNGLTIPNIVRISGPCWANEEDHDDVRMIFAEIPYTRLKELRALLEPLRERQP